MRRAMICVYWDPKSRMTICSFIEKEGKLLRPAGVFGERKRRQPVPSGNRLSKTTAMRIYLRFCLGVPDLSPVAIREAAYFFGGLHFSQTLPSFLAFTQHLCSHSLPAALAFSQQDSARTTAMLPRRTTAQRIALMDFIVLPFLPPDNRCSGSVSVVLLNRARR